MFSNERKTIGVFVERTLNEFQNRMCQGIITAAEQLGYNVAIFSAYGNYGQNERYFEGDQHLWQLPPYEELSGVILALDTMEEKSSRSRILENVRERCHCPVISVREIVEGCNNLLVDNRTCMNGIIRHFVEDHGLTRLCFMTGPESHWDAVERLECFKSQMKEYQLPVGEHQMFFGDFWLNMGEEACDWFLNGQEKPQAIICANDHMAVAVASELIHRGIRIPKDICVSGYDGLIESLSFTPSITTMTVPFFEMGKKAVQIIDEKQEHPEKIANYYFEAEVVPRESCGCLKRSDEIVIKARRNQYEEAKTERNRGLQFNFMSIHLSECYSIAEIGDKLEYYIYNIDNFKDYMVCFCENLTERKDFSTYTETMEMRIGIKDRASMGHIRIPFPRKMLLPPEVTDKNPQMWYFTPLHFQNKCFGYEAVRFQTPEVTGKLYFDWNITLSNKVQDTLVHTEMQRLIGELENMYDRDALTGMYNRRGYEMHGRGLFERAREKGTPVFLSIIDLDGMKQINDNFGHNEGDYALRTVCKAIQTSCLGENINARTGGDEFVVIAEGITEEEGVRWMQGIEKYLESFNTSGEKEYDIHASYGYVCRVLKDEDSMETYIKESDEMMYKNKVENKRRRGEPLR